MKKKEIDTSVFCNLEYDPHRRGKRCLDLSELSRKTHIRTTGETGLKIHMKERNLFLGSKHIGDEALVLAHLLSTHSISLYKKVAPLHIYAVGKSGKGKGI